MVRLILGSMSNLPGPDRDAMSRGKGWSTRLRAGIEKLLQLYPDLRVV
jgi:hypothetical protein